MAQLYTENTSNYEHLEPREETIRFLRDYSKTLKVITLKKAVFEIFVN